MIKTAVFVGIILFVISWMFGFEPNVMRWDRECVQHMSFVDYISGTRKRYGENVFITVIATVAYPGALAGAWVHNNTWARKSCHKSGA